MEILADKDIVQVKESFSALGSVRLFDGRSLRRNEIGDAEILLVRAITRVDDALLGNTAVRFVGSATAGIDHIDTDYLEDASIEFAYAAGSNARAVAEHVVTCIYMYAELRDCLPRDLSIGVIGYGNVGRALGAMLDQLGVEYAVNDPPSADELSAVSSVSLEQALGCDVVTVHVPFTRTGPYPTIDLIDAAGVQSLRPSALLINAARGGVVDESALCVRLDGDAPVYAAIDCWLNEPNVDLDLLRRAWIATPHIAGHTLEARVEAARMLHAALNVFFARSEVFPAALGHRPKTLEPAPGHTGLASLLSNVHPLADQTRALRRMLALPAARRGAHFDDVRRRYGLRREFAHFSVASDEFAPDTVAELRALGFDSANAFMRGEQ